MSHFSNHRGICKARRQTTTVEAVVTLILEGLGTARVGQVYMFLEGETSSQTRSETAGSQLLWPN